eukprot:CAMPEP_0206232448 /NCGR_PEP_ID=MMETSP0047_2-20121206/11418_1 /ASSEMBLY_ACC=CAM_ASM_000192 /TAXON_ID=195065 /ORGANISM="Chroomonas mesostigmatica_cf, Strain CCMP1168" /LENGTH=293 /DNA_ID=CAMNT_0053656179 /DNA_START=124 /DNA_END=1001 /DNA_ORIENTATION=+
MSSLSNADFKNIFATTAGSHQANGKSVGGKRGGDDDRDGKKLKKFKPSSYKREKELKAEADQYRDRAKERRLGVSSEYSISEEAVKGLTVEESKYLGGDMEHTHLVRGLDFALLAKVRSEITEHEETEQDVQKKKNHKASKGLETRTPLGEAVKNSLMRASRSDGPVELFLEGRTTFHFDLEDLFGDIPTAVSKSVEDLPRNVREKRTAVIGKSIMSSISTIMSYLRQGSRPATKKMKRKEKPDAKPAPERPAAPDDDIFEDAGGYDLEMRAKERAAAAERDKPPPSPAQKPP